jgi:hypothetical protein
MSTLRTLSGATIDFVGILKGEPQDFRIEDIAVGLSEEPRFAGHTFGTCTVGAHSIRVMQRVEILKPQQDKLLAALMHDASEAYLKDLPRGLKQVLPDYRYLESRAEKMLADAFGYPWPLPDVVKQADMEILVLEWKRFREDPPPPEFPQIDPSIQFYWEDADRTRTAMLFVQYAKGLGAYDPEDSPK